ncbi:MAG: TlpA family protein disulfide reductase [Muribaculaceae bacterium]|nr:TlpA family protein disulfide reductase [Muribaculaceae bacterium]
MSGKKEILVLFAVLIVCLSGCIGEKEEPEWYLLPGDVLPQFEVTTIDGRTVGSADSYSAELIIVFFNTTCPDCRKELPVLQRQYEENLKLPEAERSIYLCISREEGAADVERYWTENNLTLPVSPQRDRRIYSMFASIGIPRIFFAKDGLITDSLYPAE